ncbi:hypothetical protein [Bacillus thuringiensis]|uniref:hypothetical protein n=1 Tax=Bacillus thuringiensis TaxID=1428 RepID=UPI000BF84B85|nr:hypothetical protein [Bacillus thuringiensis]PFA41980.1 hypothetical protein CN416_04305 [Bacillus thuringiensis]
MIRLESIKINRGRETMICAFEGEIPVDIPESFILRMESYEVIYFVEQQVLYGKYVNVLTVEGELEYR